MSLNDPFGRVTRRHRQAYAQVRDGLIAQGVTTADAVRAAKSRLRRTSLQLLSLLVAIAALIALLLPDARAVTAIVGVLILLWLGSSYAQTAGYLNTYLREIMTTAADTREPPTTQEESEQ